MPVETERPPVEEREDEELTLIDRPWVTIVWNDPVNLRNSPAASASAG
jgi:hypothetical protein